MNQFVEQNRGFLRFYSTAAKIIGWVLICGGIIWFLLFALCILVIDDAAGDLGWSHTTENAIYATSVFVFDFVFLGLIALVLSQLIDCIVQGDYRPGPLLRFGNVILYIYALLIIARAIISYRTWRISLLGGYGTGHMLFIQPIVVPVIAKVLIIVGLAEVLRRVLSMVEESKTLV